ncbi:hypothetical protein ACJJI4_15190 [Microbulbifer sp. TRSA002]
MFKGEKLKYGVYLWGLLFITAAAYSFGVKGPFLLDDFPNLSPIAAGGGVTDFSTLYRYVVDPIGSDWIRSVARLTFLLDDQYWPAKAEKFKRTNIAIHLLTGLLIFWFLVKLLPINFHKRLAYSVALLATAVWLLHPLHVSTTLYVVQRMTQLMALFLVLALFFYVCFRLEKSPFRACFCLVGFFIAAMLSVFSKENGAVILLLVPLIEYIFLREDRRFYDVWLRVALCVGVAVFFILFSWAAYNSWSRWDERVLFSAIERLSIQGQVLAEYWGSFFFLGSGNWGLYHDDKEWLLNLNGTQLSSFWWILHIGLLAFSFYQRKKYPLVSFSIFWFYLAHIIESTIVPMELKYEHRNYLPYVGLSVGLAYLMVTLGNRLKLKYSKRAQVLVALPLVVSILLLINRAETWSDYRYLAIKWSERHPYSLRAQLSMVMLLAEAGNPQEALHKIDIIGRRFSDPSLELLRLNIQCEHEKLDNVQPVYTSLFQKQHYSVAVELQLKKMLSPEKMECVNKYLPEGGMIKLLHDIEKIPALNSSPLLYASYLDFSANAYLLMGENLLALRSREAAWEISPNVNTGIELAKLYILGGEFNKALNIIQRIERETLDSLVLDRLSIEHLSALKSALKYQSGMTN